MRLATLFALLLVAAAPRAQTFAVVSSAPADHAVSVPLETTLRLTFSGRVADPTAGAAPNVVIQPTATLGAPTRSADGLSLTFPLTLQAATRYAVLVLGAEAEAGGGLTAPFALNLTTGPSNGPITVRGTVTGAGSVAPQGSIVALVTGDLATGNIQIVEAAVVEAANGAYAVGPVPIGLYTAGAIRLPLPLGTTAEGFGYGLYDPDGDGTPNPIFATTGVNITVAPPPPRTAAEDFTGTLAAAEDALGPAPRFLAVDPAVVDAGGMAAGWSYRFEAATPGEEVRILRVGLFTLPVPFTDGGLDPDPLPPFFIDSPEVLPMLEGRGGAAFRAAHPGETVTVTLESVRGATPLWRATYRASGGDSMVFETPFNYVDAADDGPGRASMSLALRSANPSRGAVSVALRLEAPADVRVTVLDARGRVVARLVDGPLAAGEARLTWAPGTAAGVYHIVAEAGGRHATLAVTVVR